MADFFGENTEQRDIAEVQPETVVAEANPLKIDLDDKTFVDVVDKLRKDSRAFFSKRDLYSRRDKNQEYYLGQQTAKMEKENKLKKYSARYQDNVIFEAAGRTKAVAVSRVPDLLITPGNSTEESENAAETLTDVINSRIRKRENRTVLGMAYKHRPIYFTGVIKAVWDDEKGTDGDYRFENVHPNNIDVDHTASSNNSDSMNWIMHHYNLTIKEILMRWPKKEEELKQELGWEEMTGSEEEKAASTLKISEIWFTWYAKKDGKWERIEGTAWKYKKILFDKIKNPYWDWEGETTAFTFDTFKGVKRNITETDARLAMAIGQPIPNSGTEEIFHNYFEDPRKPFYFMGYDQLGMQPYDETTSLEQSLYLQDNVNVRGKQISELSATSKGKNVFSTDSHLTAKDIEEIDMGNPDQDILIDGNLRDVHTFIPGTQPTAALFQEQDLNRERLFSKMGANAALRGIRGGENTATQTQLFKESDYTTIDDEVEDTINAASEWMAGWAMQMIKLFYTEDHVEKEAGQDGARMIEGINRDLVEDGMLVEVSASSVDKLRRKKEAFDLAGIGMIDPVQFYTDIEASDPEGRAKAYMLFTMAPQMYFQQYIEGRDTTEEQIGALGGMPVEGAPMSPEAQAVAPPPEEEPVA